ncbi:MAG: MSMEG_4193 family putative phosphomutase [Candidatus Nanopelagicales bacterium]|nr:MSMEG_4193 family putative phosphomutase [Candidatus Nanopelagicales bacterium]
MTNVLLLAEGRNTAEAQGLLPGWMPDAGLDDVGRKQAEAAALRLREVRFCAIVTSPLEGCRQTAEVVAKQRRRDLPVHAELDLASCRYGDWTGMPLDVVRKEPLWESVLHVPSAVRFPGGESLSEMQIRALHAIGSWNQRLGGESTYVVVSHGDVIRSILADALGLHLDMFRRIEVRPGSISVIKYQDGPCVVSRLNDDGSDLTSYSPRRMRRGRK